MSANTIQFTGCKDIDFTAASKHMERFPAEQRRNALYAFMCNYFERFLPETVKEHRRFFSEDLRGFGENALHSMWWTLIREFKPANALEIGVYRGQTITLWGLIAKELKLTVNVHGISPFSDAGDSVCTYKKEINYKQDVLDYNKRYDLPELNLVKGYSTDRVSLDYINSIEWDLIFIDGSHDYDVVLEDYKNSLRALKPGGLIVFDDSSVYTDYQPPGFPFKGHPGPSQIVRDYAMKEMCFLGGVGHNNVFQKR